MRTIVIYCVNYHSYDSLNNYLSSIDAAVAKAKESVALTVLVADNTVPNTTFDHTTSNFQLHVLSTGENLGYFGAVQFLMQSFRPDRYDFAIISNVDVLLAAEFFERLTAFPIDSKTGWIAPAILSQSLHFDFNPQAVSRYSLKKMKTLRFMFKYPLLLRLKQILFHKYRHISNCPPGEIYAGHGSFIILTKTLFCHCGTISYPVFLYGEEIYLAETCRQNGLKVIYAPEIEVTDIGKVSTGSFSSARFCEYNFLAIDYLIKTFWEQ